MSDRTGPSASSVGIVQSCKSWIESLNSTGLEDAVPLGARHTPAIHVWLPLKPLKFRVCIQLRPKKGEPPPCKRQPYSQVTPQRPWRLPARSTPTHTPPLIQPLSTLSASPLARRAPTTKAGWVQPSPTLPPGFRHAAVPEVHEQSPQQSWARGRQAASRAWGGAWAGSVRGR